MLMRDYFPIGIQYYQEVLSDDFFNTIAPNLPFHGKHRTRCRDGDTMRPPKRLTGQAGRLERATMARPPDNSSPDAELVPRSRRCVRAARRRCCTRRLLAVERHRGQPLREWRSG